MQPSLTGRGNVFRHRGGHPRRGFLASAGKPLRYSRISLIRCAGGVRCVANAAKSVVTAFPDVQVPSHFASEGGIRPAMLPGFRFLFAAILLSMSILVFGLGAAALLRAAHEEFASNPSWRGAPETMFAQQAEATRPVLAMLRVEPATAEAKPSENTRAVAMPTEQAASIAPATQAPTEQAAAPPPPTGPEKIAALRLEEASLPEAARPEIPALESPAQSETAPAPADAPAAADANKSPAPTAADEAKVASTEQVSNQAGPPSSEQASVQASPDTDSVSTKIATLGGPAIAVKTPPAKAVGAIPDQSAAKKRLQARRAAHRRRLAARARQAQLARLLPPLPPDPFAQSSAQPPTAARNH